MIFLFPPLIRLVVLYKLFSLCQIMFNHILIKICLGALKPKRKKKCVITKRQEERDLVFLVLVCYFCKEKKII